MKTLFGTTALVMALAAPVLAQNAAPMEPTATDTPFLQGVDRGLRASDVIGKRVYVTESDLTTAQMTAMAEADSTWEDAGEISDLILSLSGDTEAVLVDVGGFLGIGEKTVAVSMANLVMVPDTDSPDGSFIVFQGSKAALEAAPTFDPDFVVPAAAETGAADMTAAPATDDGMLDFATMTDSDLVGKRVMGLNNEDLGEISAVALDTEGKISAAVVDVGGFLGMGEKPVALGSDALTLVRGTDGAVDHFMVSMTKEQLESLPTHSE